MALGGARMRMSRGLLAVAVVVAGALSAGELPVPLIDLPLAGSLANRGTLGGEAAFAEYAAGQGPLYDLTPVGECIDFTQASRHGGALGEDTAPAGGAVVFPGDRLVGIDTFTVIAWIRQNPAVEGVSARLAMTATGWDVLPSARGLSLSFLAGEDKKTSVSLQVAPFDRGRLPAASDWRFAAMAVGAETVHGYLGGIAAEPVALREAPRPGTLQPAWGDLVIGNLMQIRPFNGWVARFRVYDRALTAAEIAAIAAADRADFSKASARLLEPRPEALRSPVFRRSAIPFSTRWQRPEAVAVMQSFHATDCLWVYGSKRDYVASIQATGLRYQGALNGLQGTAKATAGKAAAGDLSGRHEDLDGNKNMPTWMVTFKPPHYTGCCNQPAFRDIFLTDAKAYVDLGVDMIHVDDSAMNASWVNHAGVCFCAACRTGFREYLRQAHTAAELQALGVASLDTFDYREHLKANGIPDATTYRKQFRTLPLTPDFSAFQVESTRAFYRELRARLDQWSPTRHIAISVNEGTVLPVADAPGRLVHADLVDFYHGEAYDRSFATNLTGGKTAEALGLQHVSTPVLQGVADGARTLALAYALGQFQLVPWDVYMGSDETGSVPRYNGTRADFGAFYDLIQAQPQLFDAARSLAALGVLVNADVETTPRLTRMCERLAARQLPFSLVVSASRQARIPLREADLRGLRVLITLSPLEGLPAADRACLERVLAERRLRLVSADADLEAMVAARGLDMLGFEGPPGITLFPRLAANGTLLIHVVNWALSADPTRPEIYAQVTVALRHLRQWGPFDRVTYWQPGAAPLALTPEPHVDSLRLTLPRLETWGILALAPADGP